MEQVLCATQQRLYTVERAHVDTLTELRHEKCMRKTVDIMNKELIESFSIIATLWPTSKSTPPTRSALFSTGQNWSPVLDPETKTRQRTLECKLKQHDGVATTMHGHETTHTSSQGQRRRKHARASNRASSTFTSASTSTSTSVLAST